MGSLRIKHAGDDEWVATEDFEGQDFDGMADRVRSDFRILHPGSDSELQLFEVRVPPDTKIGAHAHEADEIVYVLEGHLHVGRQALGAGSSVYVPGNTLYSFGTGDDGVRFLNFRARRDESYISRERFAARRGTG